MNDWIEYLVPIIEDFKGSNKEPLSVDEIDTMCLVIRAKVNHHQGNITGERYAQMVEKIYAPFGIDNKWRDILLEGKTCTPTSGQ